MLSASALAGGAVGAGVQMVGAATAQAATPAPGPSATTQGVWLATDRGALASMGVPPLGSAASLPLAQPVVGMASTPDGSGYWLVARDGGVFSYGDARFHGSTGGLKLAQPVVGMATDPATGGYWLVAADGGVFSFGAPFYGSTGGIHLNQPVVGMASTPDGHGYWLVARDGGVFAFGDARFLGSTGNVRLAQPVVGMAADPATGGYWLAAADGGVFSYGANFFGSGVARLTRPAVSIVSAAGGQGYWVVSSDGRVLPFGGAWSNFTQPMTDASQPVVGAAIGAGGGPQSASTPLPGPAPSGPVVWSSSAANGSTSIGGYNVKNNCWNSGHGPQTMYVYSWNHWYVSSDQPNSSSVKCYPSIQYLTNNKTVGSFSTISSSFSMSSPQGPGIQWDEAYDIWTNGIGGSAWQNEIMIWNASTGQPFPWAGSSAQLVNIAGVQYYYWSNGANYHAIQLANPTEAGSVNILADLQFFESKGVISASSQMQSIEYGVEISRTGGGPQTFTLNNYSLTAR